MSAPPSLFAGILCFVFAVAPFQCPSDPDPDKRREETPGEALYDLAGEFKKSGDKEAYASTLQYLIKKYPRSRHAVQAHQELEAMGITSPDPRDLADPAHAAPRPTSHPVPSLELPSSEPAPAASASAAP
ncbi:MAG: hypothetical protein HOV80_12240 [Polyangiaceae bacterium]|nr:hypothetical protein [Polyangiaceae bacterium]